MNIGQVGSGNYIEYQDLQDYARRGGAGVGVKNVVYGSTELVTVVACVCRHVRLTRRKGVRIPAAAQRVRKEEVQQHLTREGEGGGRGKEFY